MRAELVKTAETKAGCISYFADDEFIGRALASCGEYSPGEVALWAKLLKIGDKVIDVGANIGALTLPLAKIVGSTGKVFAFEPQPENFGLLLRNITENDLGSVIVPFQNGLGHESRVMAAPMLCELEDSNYGHIVLSTGSQSVNVVTLDSVLPECDVQLIKIDVEGLEEAVIEGGKGVIERCRPLLYVETAEGRSEGLLRLIRRLGYRVFAHLPPLVPRDCYAQDRVGRPFREIVSINALAVPKEKLEQFADATRELRPLIPASPQAGKSGWAGIARLGGIGDNLMAASVLRPLKRAGYNTDVITQMPMAVVFENNPFIDKLSIKGAKDLPADNREWHNWFRARAREYDVFANLSHTCEVSLAITSTQTPAQWPASMRRKYFGHSYIEFVHDAVGVPYEFGPLFFPTDEERDHALVVKKRIGAGPIIGWTLNGSRVDKSFSKAPLAIGRLIKELGAQVVMFGGPPPWPDFAAAKQIQENVINQNGSDRGLHLALSPDANNPSWPIRRMLTQLQYCDLVIGPDTGQMWSVAFESMPKIMLHSHASVQNIVKHWINTKSLHASAEVGCWPCHLLLDGVEGCQDEQRRCGLSPSPEDKGAACISSISVESVISAARAALGGIHV
jgi:FkbM family methyltransferase